MSQVDGIKNSEEEKRSDSINNQPNVRHIPIFVEGRDEPIINIIPENIASAPPLPHNNEIPLHQHHVPPHSQSQQPIFNRVKNIPVRKPSAEFEIPTANIPPRSQSPGGVGGVGRTIPTSNIPPRSQSPGGVGGVGRTIPIKVEHVQTNPVRSQSPVGKNININGNSFPSHPQATTVQQQSNNETSRSRSTSPMPSQKPMDSITKIQNIQKEVIELMKKVEGFKATSRKDKEYLYLDEMLTQNLLKLDTIDTEGKENIKAARKEAINCINKCISVLEAKVEQGSSGNSDSGAKENNVGAEKKDEQDLNQQTEEEKVLQKLQEYQNDVKSKTMEVKEVAAPLTPSTNNTA